jgi:hypothetical protein
MPQYESENVGSWISRSSPVNREEKVLGLGREALHLKVDKFCSLVLMIHKDCPLVLLVEVCFREGKALGSERVKF